MKSLYQIVSGILIRRISLGLYFLCHSPSFFVSSLYDWFKVLITCFNFGYSTWESPSYWNYESICLSKCLSMKGKRILKMLDLKLSHGTNIVEPCTIENGTVKLTFWSYLGVLELRETKLLVMQTQGRFWKICILWGRVYFWALRFPLSSLKIFPN